MAAFEDGMGSPGGSSSSGGGAVTVADAADATQGATTDVAIASDAAGTLSAKLRGLVKLLAAVTDLVNSRLRVDGSGVTQPVSGTFWQATQPVSGAFFQATQPVSGTVTSNQGGTWTVQPGNTANTTAWKVDGSAVTQPVSGAFFQATQPVSGTVTANQGSANATPWNDNVAQIGGTAAPAPTAKGTQAATALSVQEFKDAGRTAIVLAATGIASVASEALVTIQKNVGGTVTTGVTEYVVTAGKTLRVQAITITARATTPSTTVTFSSDTWKFRQAAGATLAITSPLTLTATAMCSTNVPGGVVDLSIPDGLEFPAATHVGFSQVGTTGMTFDLNLIGYEY